MRTLFFYGTLRHLPLLEIVLGRPAGDLAARPAVLPGYRTLSVAEGPFPTLVEDRAASADGIVIEGVDVNDLTRLDFYEAGFDYDLVPVTLKNGQDAEVYRSAEGRWTAQGDWSLAQWESRWGEMTCHAAAEVMRYLGEKTRHEVAAIFGPIRARAWSRINAGTSRHGAGTLEGRIEVAHHARVYSDFFALDEIDLSFERFDGSMSPCVRRSVFVPVDAALVLPYDPVRDVVLMVEQMRIGPLVRGDRVRWQYEPIAGRVDPGETPEETARREAREEANVTIGALHSVAETYASPGNSTEFFYVFVGIADLPDSAEGVAGLAAEAEDIRSQVISFDDLMALCDTCRIANTPLALASYWLARHRPALRSDAGAATP